MTSPDARRQTAKFLVCHAEKLVQRSSFLRRFARLFRLDFVRQSIISKPHDSFSRSFAQCVVEAGYGETNREKSRGVKAFLGPKSYQSDALDAMVLAPSDIS
jgi:hypothetical protein